MIVNADIHMTQSKAGTGSEYALLAPSSLCASVAVAQSRHPESADKSACDGGCNATSDD
jgi:hypothetical protein